MNPRNTAVLSNSIKLRPRHWLLLAVAASLASPVVYSQMVLEEIVVTARKRSESIQDVPVSVTAIEKELKESTVRRLEDIQNFAAHKALCSERTPLAA